MAKQLNELVFIDDSGFHVADYEDFLTYHQDAFKTIYGQDINLDADSQDGQLCAHFAQTNYDLAMICAATFNNYSPSTAAGEGLSRQVKINGLKRQSATKSTVDLLITGTAGTGINNGQVKDASDNTWILPSLITIPVGGSITVTATAENDGPIRAAVNTVTKIATPMEGWISVTNPSEAVPGRKTETDAELRARQTQSTSLPAVGPLVSIKGNVLSVAGVTQAEVYENDTDETDANGIPAHSICAVVEGGDSQAIAETLRRFKAVGVGTYGTTNITVTDEQSVPIVINFFRPTIIHVKVKVTLRPLTGYSSTYADEIKQEIVEYINSLGIGSTVYLSKLYVPANLVASDHDSSFDVVGITIGKGDGDQQAANITAAFNELPYTENSYIEVAIDDD